MRSFAVLIDGGFVKRKIGSAKSPLTAEVLAEFLERLKLTAPLDGMYLHRMYFYDAAPLETEVQKPLNGGRLNFAAQATAVRSREMHEKISRIAYMSLRQGELMFRGWSVSKKTLNQNSDGVTIRADDLRPDIQQKGVDMRIGLDIAALTLKKQVDVIVLVTGDSDFVPAMKFARREGAQLFLVPLGHGIREPMREHADLILSVDFPLNSKG